MPGYRHLSCLPSFGPVGMANAGQSLRKRSKPVERDKASAKDKEQTGRSRLEKENQASRKESRIIWDTEVNHSEDSVGFEKVENLRNRSKPVERD